MLLLDNLALPTARPTPFLLKTLDSNRNFFRGRFSGLPKKIVPTFSFEGNAAVLSASKGRQIRAKGRLDRGHFDFRTIQTSSKDLGMPSS
jgi:hypothetical protein